MQLHDIKMREVDIRANEKRLINQIWKLIPMWENNEDWHKQLSTVIVEVIGLLQIFETSETFIQLLSKLEGIQNNNDITFRVYRKTIFECINLLQEFISE